MKEQQKALKAITDTVPDNAGEPVTTTETTVRFTNLKPGTSYVFMIVGVNHNKSRVGKSSLQRAVHDSGGGR